MKNKPQSEIKGDDSEEAIKKERDSEARKRGVLEYLGLHQEASQ
jgi:hypothetical protein